MRHAPRRSFRSLRSALAVVAGAAILGGARPAAAGEGDTPDIEGRRLAHILGYIEADYRNAVDKGAVIHEAEYNEQLALLDDAATIAARLDRAGATQGLLDRVRKARAPVIAKAPEETVKAAVASVRAAVVSALKIDDAPAKRPDRARGEALFLEHCATCHGATGRADTPRAKTLSPPPIDFHDPGIGEGMSPHRVATTVRFGISGTAMIPFTFLSEEDRWDLGFYTTSLRHLPGPGDGGAPAFSLAELAMATDGEVLDDLYSAGLSEEELSIALAKLRIRAPYDAGGEPLLAGRAALDRARLLLLWGDRGEARDQIGEAYIRGVAPGLGALRAAGAGAAGDIEARFLALRGAPATADVEGLRADVGLLLRALLAADPHVARATGQGAPSASASGLAVWGSGEPVAAALGVLGAMAMGWRRRGGEGEARRARRTIGWLAGAAGLGIGAAILARQGAGAWCAILPAALAVAASAGGATAGVTPRAAEPSESSGLSVKSCFLFGSALAGSFAAAFDAARTALSLPSSIAAATGVVIGGVALAAAAASPALSARILSPPRRALLARAALLLSAALFAARGIAGLELAGALPTHSLGLPSITTLGLHPTLEVIAAIALILATPLAASILLRRRAPQAPSGPAA